MYAPRLFEPERLKHFCPGEHCAAPCGAGSCKCAPCFPSCRFCKERKRVARLRRSLADIPAAPRQFKLFTGRI